MECHYLLTDAWPGLQQGGDLGPRGKGDGDEESVPWNSAGHGCARWQASERLPELRERHARSLQRRRPQRPLQRRFLPARGSTRSTSRREVSGQSRVAAGQPWPGRQQQTGGESQEQSSESGQETNQRTVVQGGRPPATEVTVGVVQAPKAEAPSAPRAEVAVRVREELTSFLYSWPSSTSVHVPQSWSSLGGQAILEGSVQTPDGGVTSTGLPPGHSQRMPRKA